MNWWYVTMFLLGVVCGHWVLPKVWAEIKALWKP